MDLQGCIKVLQTCHFIIILLIFVSGQFLKYLFKFGIGKHKEISMNWFFPLTVFYGVNIFP